jgi:enoyl-CoA hydratase
VLHVTIARPEKRNALNNETLEALRDVFALPPEDLAAALLTGRGEKAFAAGGDLRELQALDTAPAIEAQSRIACAALAAIRAFPVPVVAALNGDALGGGAELALACDVRVAASHARLAFLQGTLALPPAWGGGEDLLHAVGPARAIELLASSRMLSAPEALALDLVQFVAPAGASFEDWTAQWLATWSHQRPQVMRAVKAGVRAMREGVAPQARAARNVAAFVECWLHPDHVQAADRRIAGLGR